MRASSPLLASASVIAIAVFAFGSGVAACGLGSNIDDVLQPEDGAATSGTTAGSAAGGTGAGGNGSGSSSGTGVVMGPEACLDGADNDGDGMTDCEDSDCNAGYECVDAPPEGWDGLYRVTQTSQPGSMPVACDGGTSPETYFAGPAGPAECTPCTCSDVMGAVCSGASISCWPGSTQCMGNPQDWTPALQAQQCNKPLNLLGISTTLSCLISAPGQLVENGACQASQVTFPNTETWSAQVDACALPASGGGCGAAKACVPKGSDPSQSVCLKADGAKACPAGYAVTVDAYKSGTDTRGCDACGCGDATVTCGGSYTFFDANNCDPNGGNTPPIPVDSASCTNVSGQLDAQSWSVETDPPPAGGSCPPKGGGATGEVTTDGPVTFCCK
jgi:hypothetical protein